MWEKVDIPVVVYAEDKNTHHVIYQNAAADLLLGENCSYDRLFCADDFDEAEPSYMSSTGKIYAIISFMWEDLLVCELSDRTELYKRNRAALNEAKLASQAKTNFLSEMSHDIRTPMNAIMGMTDIALRQEGLAARTRDCLEKIKLASDNMLSLINEVLDMSRIESGRVTLQESEQDIADILHEVLVVARAQAEQAGIEFKFKSGKFDEENIIVDAVRLKQVIMNLVSNAVKFTPKGGRVELYLDIVSEDSETVSMHLRVSDTGIGMSTEFMRRLFTPFEREQSATVSKIQGTGLGMAICKSLVEMMHGEIQAESSQGKGTTFELEIPFKIADNNEDIYLKALTGKHVLLLCDDDEQSEHVMAMLERLGIKADLARDALRSVMLLNDTSWNGYEYFAFITAERIKNLEMLTFLPQVRSRMGSDFPMLMLSESDWSQIEYTYKRSGIDEFIPLPLFKSRLAAALYAFTDECRRKENKKCDETVENLSGRRILLVEDNELNREIATELLEASDAFIEAAENGREAVDMFETSKVGYYDVILMDIQMPVMNGFEAAGLIRGLDRSDAKTIPIIAMTANAFVEDVQKSLAAGMNAHIPKPLDINKLLSCINSLLDGRAQ